MIVKKARGRQSGASSFTDLARYILDEAKSAGLKLHSDNLADFKTAAAVMEQTAGGRNPRDPILHLVLSLPEGERNWTEAEARQSINRMLEAVGMEEHQWIASVHGDTDNFHLHLMVNRVDPKSQALVTPYRDYPALHRAARQLEIEQNRAHDRGIYVVEMADGRKEIVREAILKARAISGRAREFEIGSGKPSFQRWLKENDALRAALARATSWRELHQYCDVFGLVSQKRPANGRRLSDGLLFHDRRDRRLACPGSKLGPDFSLKALEDRMGPYQNTPYLDHAEAGEIIGQLLENRSTVSLAELSGFLETYLEHDRRDQAYADILAHPDLAPLADPGSDQATHFSTRKIVAEEQETLELALALNSEIGMHRPDRRAVQAFLDRQAAEGKELNPGQRAGLEAGLAGERLVIVQGRAGVGKSHTMRGWIDAYRGAGLRVIGATKQNALLPGMRADGFGIDAMTLDSLLLQAEAGRLDLDDCVIVVDEAGMLENDMLLRLFRLAQHSNCLIRLVGDDLQLPAVGRGGVFGALCRQLKGGAVIGTIIRQLNKSDREAAQCFSEGRFWKGIRILEENGSLSFTNRTDQAVDKLASLYIDDLARARQRGSTETRQAFAYTNADVATLNQVLRQAHKEAGDIGEEFGAATAHGPTAFGTGDRIVITRTDKRLGFAAGETGRVTAIDPDQHRIEVRFEASDTARWIPLGTGDGQWGHVRHGYCTTVYKGQGQTIDHVYLLHDRYWKDAAAYVALTRTRRRSHIVGAREVAVDSYTMARQMQASMLKQSSLSFVPCETLADPQRRTRRAVYDEDGLATAWRAELTRSDVPKQPRQTEGVPSGLQRLERQLRRDWETAKNHYEAHKPLWDFEWKTMRERAARERKVLEDRHREERLLAGIRRGRKPKAPPQRFRRREEPELPVLGRQRLEKHKLKGRHTAAVFALSCQAPHSPGSFKTYVDHRLTQLDPVARRYRDALGARDRAERGADQQEKAERRARHRAQDAALRAIDIRDILKNRGWRLAGSQPGARTESWQAPEGGDGHRNLVQLTLDRAGRATRYRHPYDQRDRGSALDFLRRGPGGRILHALTKVRLWLSAYMAQDAHVRDVYYDTLEAEKQKQAATGQAASPGPKPARRPGPATPPVSGTVANSPSRSAA